MLSIAFYGTERDMRAVGELCCKALAGNEAFANNDIVVNYDTPGEVLILLGDENERDIAITTIALCLAKKIVEREKM